jgi:hypothetical protein
MTFICKWCVLSLNISFWVQCSKSLQSILLPFLHPVFPIKLNSICPHSHIHELLAPQPPLHLPSVSFFLLVSSSLSTGGELPRRWSSTRAGKLPHRGATARSASRRAPPPPPPASPPNLRTLIPALKVVVWRATLPRQSPIQSCLEGGDGDAARCETTRRPVGWMDDEHRLP